MITKLNEDNAEEISRPIFESIHSAYASADYQQCMENCFSVKMVEVLTEEVFIDGIQKYYSSYGDLVEMKYLGYVDRDVGHQLIWKCRYTKNTEEVVWQMYFSKENDENHEIVGLWFGY